MEIMNLVPFILVGLGAILGLLSALYTYKFVRAYEGKFREPLEYIFYSIVFFSLLVIEFGTFGIFGATATYAIVLSLSAIGAFFLMFRATKLIYEEEVDLVLEHLQEKKQFLEKKAELIRERFYKRKIDEQIFKDLVKDLEKEIIDIDAKIAIEKERCQK
jgi:flagellar biosynthesis protein FliP